MLCAHQSVAKGMVNMKNYIIPIFIPHFGCPHQCVFCNQKKITGAQHPMTPSIVEKTISEHLVRINRERHIEVAFYGGSFTALPINKQQELLTPAYRALKAGNVHAIRISTRPDYINNKILDLLRAFGVSTIELGAQSLDDKVLLLTARGHTSKAINNAVRLIKSAGIKCGLQLMVGLFGEDWPSLIRTTQLAADLRPDFARIYPTLVIADTYLAKLYQEGFYTPLTIHEAIARCAFMKLVFERHNIPVIRTGLQASEDLNDYDVVLAGPYHPAFGEMVDAHIFNAMVIRCLDNFTKINSDVFIHHHPNDTSKLRGLCNANTKAWKKKFFNINVKLLADGATLGQLEIEANDCRCIITKKML